MKYWIIGLLIIYITALLHKALKNWWRRRTKDKILENLEEITEDEKQKRRGN